MLSLPFQSKTSFSTSEITLTGIIFIFPAFSLSIIISFRFALGTITFLIPASIAASTLELTPPIGNTSPLTESDPVKAYSCFIGSFFNAEMIEVATAIEAESPSTPSYVCKN